MKFFNLLKKELAELINTEMILTMVIMFVLLMVSGNVMNTTIEETLRQEYTVNVSDRDNTDFTRSLIQALRDNGAEVNEYTTSGDDYAGLIDTSGKKSMIIIPEGFTEQFNNGEKPEIINISELNNASIVTNNTADTGSTAIRLISACLSDIIAEENGISAEDIEKMSSPLQVREHTVVNENTAEIDSTNIISKIFTQNMLLPIIVLVIIMMTSQTIINAIANEKIDKTLETLLSSPVSRTAIIGAKTLSAAIAALLYAVIFMFAFSSIMSGTTASLESELTGSIMLEVMSIDEAMDKLGLTLGMGDYILVGVQLFFTIMICLSISIILGALVTDTKQSQTIIMPILIAAIIPYMVSMLTDMNSLPLAAKIVMYIIPFTHTFSAISNIMFGNMIVFWGGLAYQAVVFAVCMFFALKLFNSDKILTASLNFGQKSRYKKSAKSDE